MLVTHAFPSFKRIDALKFTLTVGIVRLSVKFVCQLIKDKITFESARGLVEQCRNTQTSPYLRPSLERSQRRSQNKQLKTSKKTPQTGIPFGLLAQTGK